MLAWAVLIVLSVIAFGVLGLALGVFRLNISVRVGFGEVAELMSFVDDDEEDSLLLDDDGYDIDDDTDEAFIEIAKALEDLEREGNKIARREESA